ncbi:craniofacial development protein 2-like [Penaeus indicus]|uniref:craniofacial development protein 2-like n=1 Tax=Penaeus indicus TaxID=29960 RepID=UPI00300D6FD3
MAVQHITENSNNDVKGSFLEATSSGRVRHELQVTPDRHQANALKNQHLLKLTTWIARTMNKTGKLENIKEEMNRLHINIMGISEMRWTGAGAISSENHKIIYSGGEQHERGSSDEDIDRFYAQLDQAYSQCKSQDIIIVMGDFNAKVGNERVDNIVDPHGLGSRNERGEMLVEWVQTNNMIIGNTWFKQPPRRLWTWLSPDDHTRNQIDYILVNKHFRNSLLASKTLPGADCYNDHVPVMGRFRAKMRTLKKPTLREQLDVSLLQKDNTIKEKYTVEVKNRFSVLEDLDSIEDHWKGLKVSIMDAANKVLPRVRRTTKKKWMTDEILLLMERRRASKNNKEAYQHLNKQITIKCNEAKEAWLTEKCKEVEKHHNSDSRAMHKKIREITNIKTQSSSGCLKSKMGGTIMERDKILER